MEGYIAFPWYVARVLWSKKWLYIRLLVLFVFLSTVAVGAAQVTNLGSINEVIGMKDVVDIIGPVYRALITVGAAIGGALNGSLSDVQWLLLSSLCIVAMLTTVWLLRQQLAGNKVKLRDGVYNAMAPLAAEYVLLVIAGLQLIPLALTALVYVTATTNGLLEGGIETAMFSLAFGLVIVLTLYFMTTTIFAMFITTIQGTYPIKAYKAARKIVAGQRLRLLLRLLFMLIAMALTWFMVLIPIVIVTNSLNAGSTIVIPIAFQIMVGGSFIYGIAYGYLLYRRMIDAPVDAK